MKIGILSLSLGRNYGGILQLYALSKYLESLGHQVVVLNRQPNDGGTIKKIIRKVLSMMGIKRYRQPLRIEINIDPFIQREFTFSVPAHSSRQFAQLCKKEGLDAIFYGSDQIWRREFEQHCGLDFFGASTPKYVRQVAYAPSFGLDVWEYSPKETMRIKLLLSRFKALSCRESSGAQLINDKLNLVATVVCDPTILLTVDDYNEQASEHSCPKGYCFVYWLGDEQSMNKTIDRYSRIQGLDVVTINLRTTTPLPTIEDWLSLIKNASYVITDSYHGTVFSLLFHKQFYVYCNNSGGFSRIETLFNVVGVQGKLNNPDQELDYALVEPLLNRFRFQSRLFINNSLSE